MSILKGKESPTSFSASLTIVRICYTADSGQGFFKGRPRARFFAIRHKSELWAEINSLYQVIEDEAGLLAADGGYLGDGIYGNLPQTSWQKLTRMFLNP